MPDHGIRQVIFHPHLHVLAADGLLTPDGRFHCMHAEDLAPAIELFRHRFLQALRDGGEKPVPAHDTEGRKRLTEYLLRHLACR